jgi:DNA-binding winged helix-turn-helix (wHTH) protein
VSALRKALGDTREHAEFIETVPTKGYRFVAKVVRHKPTMVLGPGPQAPGLPAAPAPERPSARRRPSWVVAGLFVAAAMGAAAGTAS